MNRWWRGFGAPTEGPEIETWGIPLDVIEEGDIFIVRASMPGVNPDNIQVSIEDNVLTIRGQTSEEFERKDGNYLMKARQLKVAVGSQALEGQTSGGQTQAGGSVGARRQQGGGRGGE